jgi:hypothetical protein
MSEHFRDRNTKYTTWWLGVNRWILNSFKNVNGTFRHKFECVTVNDASIQGLHSKGDVTRVLTTIFRAIFQLSVTR